MDTRSSTSKGKNGAHSPSPQREVPTGGTSATPRTRSQTRRESESKSIPEASHNVELLHGTSAAFTPRRRSQTRRESGSKSIPEASHNVELLHRTSAAFTPRRRSQTRRESGSKSIPERESKACHENPTKPMRVSLPPGPMRELTISTGSSYQIQTIRKVVHAPIGSLMPVSMQEQQGPI
jgi:hypothetical protein